MVEVPSSFDVFYETHRKRALRLAIALCGESARGEEIVQDAFVSAFAAWARISDYDRPDAWLMRVVANRSISVRRRVRTESKLVARLAALEPRLPGVPDAASEDAMFIAQLVCILPKRQAQCLALRYVDEQSSDEIAASLGISASTVRVHLHRALQTIETAMSRRQSAHE
ncbi:MAG: polymerase sigma-70 factor, subfamily [Actinomycetota bacterium]|nr:polymerase sigma-70 factor, subfamily [Actinomycetota bacterium]